jgi:hypothetical protein
MLQLNPPLARVIVDGPGWTGPTGKGVANFIDPGHRDDDIIWIIDLDENGQTWCVPNRFVRAPRNITYGRNADPATYHKQPVNGDGAVHGQEASRNGHGLNGANQQSNRPGQDSSRISQDLNRAKSM